jgi:hypothetical protein
MSGDFFTEQERVKVKLLLSRYDASKDIRTREKLYYDISNFKGRMLLKEFEVMYREFQSETFLIAYPYANDPDCISIDPITRQETPFYLFTCLYGHAQTRNHLERLGITPEQNLKNLLSAGYLIPRTDESFNNNRV